MHWYKSSIQYKINFWILCLALKWNALLKKVAMKSSHQKLGGEPKTVMFSDLQTMRTQLTE